MEAVVPMVASSSPLSHDATRPLPQLHLLHFFCCCSCESLYVAASSHLPSQRQPPTIRRQRHALFLLRHTHFSLTYAQGFKQQQQQHRHYLANYISINSIEEDNVPSFCFSSAATAGEVGYNPLLSCHRHELIFEASSDFSKNPLTRCRSSPPPPPTHDNLQMNSIDLERSNLDGAELAGLRTAVHSVPESFIEDSKSDRKIVKTAWEKLVRWSRSWQLLQARSQHDQSQHIKKVVVLGGGSFGTAMAVLLARKKAEMEVRLLVRDVSMCETINEQHINMKYFPHHILPNNIVATVDAKEALTDAQFCIHAIPVQASGAFLRNISRHVPSTLPFLSVSKGLELSTLEMMSQVIPKALGNPRQPLAVLSGPSFSIELMDHLPTAVVVASKDKEVAKTTQQLLASRYLRVNTSSDVVGVEIGGALKNVLAIAAGIVEGMNLGNNCMAALVAQGCSEIRWLAEKMGGKSSTLAGLAGAGDIMLTCFVKLSRNRSVGVRLGSGERLECILSSMNQVAEGIATAGAVIALARKYRVQMPVLTAVARILDNELTPKAAMLELMSLPQVEEK